MTHTRLKRTDSSAATAAYDTDGRAGQWQAQGRHGGDWHTVFGRLLDQGHIFMGQTYTATGVLFRGMPGGLWKMISSRRLWHSETDNPLCRLERDLDVIFCSEVARDALAVARPWEEQDRDAVILIFSGQIFVERWQARTAAMLGFADVGMVFKYPCLAEPLSWSELYGVVVHPDALAALESSLAELPDGQRPYLAAPRPDEVSQRDSWQVVIDELLAREQQLPAVCQPTDDYPRLLPS